MMPERLTSMLEVRNTCSAIVLSKMKGIANRSVKVETPEQTAKRHAVFEALSQLFDEIIALKFED